MGQLDTVQVGYLVGLVKLGRDWRAAGTAGLRCGERQDNLDWQQLQDSEAVAVDYLVRTGGSSEDLLVAGDAEVRRAGAGVRSEAWAAGK